MAVAEAGLRISHILFASLPSVRRGLETCCLPKQQNHFLSPHYSCGFPALGIPEDSPPTSGGGPN